MSQNNQDSEKYNPNDIPVMRFEPKRLTVRELKEIVNQCDDEQGVFLYDHTDSDSW